MSKKQKRYIMLGKTSDFELVKKLLLTGKSDVVMYAGQAPGGAQYWTSKNNPNSRVVYIPKRY